jgi:hypothetical protein
MIVGLQIFQWPRITGLLLSLREGTAIAAGSLAALALFESWSWWSVLSAALVSELAGRLAKVTAKRPSQTAVPTAMKEQISAKKAAQIWAQAYSRRRLVLG